MFNLRCRGFRQRITLTSSAPMTLNDVIVHVKQFVIALVSVDGCSSFPDPDGFFDVPDSSVGFLVYNFHSLPVYDVVFSCRMVCKGGFIDGRHQSFFPAPCVFLFFSCCQHPFCVPPVVFLVVFLSPQCTQHQFLHGIWYTSSPCSSSSTLSLGCTNKHLRVVWGRMAVATPYFFSTRCTLSETPSTYGMTTWFL